MARVLLILSIVLTLITAGLGFIAKQKVEDLNKAIADRTSQLNSTKTKLKKTEEDLAATKKDLETTKAQLEEATTALAAAKKEANDATQKLAEVSGKLDAQTKQLEDVMAKLEAASKGLKIEDLANELERLKTESARLATELAESKQVQETLTQRAKDAEDKFATAQRVVDAYKFSFVKNGLSGKVLAYNPGWNFVVLSIGDKAGLKPGVNMIVQRGNTMIAKLKVTTVEPNTAIADVLPGTMRGGKVEPGDTVIFEGPRQ